MDNSQIDFINVKGGAFIMGAPRVPKRKFLAHEVEVNSFKMSKYMITLSQFKSFLEEYGSDLVKSGEYQGQKMTTKQKRFNKEGNSWQIKEGHKNFPVAATWHGANEFCNFYGYRLPTEAEWEYAAKGGLLSQGFNYSGSNNLDAVAWHKDSSFNKEHFAVGQKEPNELGFYDMSGLMTEWSSDWHSNKYYAESPKNNPQGPATRKAKVKRGGSTNFLFSKSLHYVSCRDLSHIDVFMDNEGFRPVMNIEDENEVTFDEDNQAISKNPSIGQHAYGTPEDIKKESKKSGRTSLIMGIVLLLGGVIGSVATQGQVLFYGAVGVGLGLIIKGALGR
jgi:formylglycine-generating enzyme